jgi:hypothetical protein
MAVPYKQKDTMLQFLHHYKAYTLQFSVKFQTGHSIFHRLLQSTKETQHFLIRHQDELWQNYLKSAISVHQLALFQYVKVSCGPHPQNQVTLSKTQATPHNSRYMWWCYILQDLQHFILVRARNSAQHQTDNRSVQ